MFDSLFGNWNSELLCIISFSYSYLCQRLLFRVNDVFDGLIDIKPIRFVF